MNKTSIFLILPLIFLGGIFGVISTASAQCPPDTINCPWGAWSVTNHVLWRLPDCEIAYQYRTRWCNGQLDVDYVLISSKSNCADGLRPSTLKEYVELMIIENETEAALDDSSIIIPNCDDIGSSVKIVNFYTASCGIWLSCEYDIIPQVPDCEQGLDAPPAGPTTVKTWTWKSCGSQCCKNVYNICIGTSVIGGRVVRIKNVERGQVETPCSEQSTYAKPCASGC